MEATNLLNAEEIQRILSRLAHEILERSEGADEIALIGIRSRGAYLVQRIARKVEALAGVAPAVGVVDVTPYRDDVAKSHPAGAPPAPKLPALDEKTVVLVDDVIYTGRTIRAALDLLATLGKPRKVLVCTLVDRGRRELPIRADIVGKNVEAGAAERVNVMLEEADGVDQVTVTPMAPPPPGARERSG